MDYQIFSLFLAFFAVYGLASFAGLLSERSGTVNIGLEGSMIMGGLTFSLIMANTTALQGVVGGPFLAMLVAGVVGMLFSTLFSLATVNFMGDHIISGTAMNMIAPALSFIILIPLMGKSSVEIQSQFFVYAGEANSSINLTALFSFIFAIMIFAGGIFLLKKTSWGLRLRASGENPYALETAGVSVSKTRWIVNSFVGFFAAFAGAIACITFESFNSTMTGMGFIAIAILILGRWNIYGIAAGTLIMSLTFSIIKGYSWSPDAPTELLNIIPFVLPILFLIFIRLSSEMKFSKRFHNHIYEVPDSLGDSSHIFYLITYWWIIYLLYWTIYGIPALIAKFMKKDKQFWDYLLNKDSRFAVGGGAPAAVGKAFKKDLR